MVNVSWAGHTFYGEDQEFDWFLADYPLGRFGLGKRTGVENGLSLLSPSGQEQIIQMSPEQIAMLSELVQTFQDTAETFDEEHLPQRP